MQRWDHWQISVAVRSWGSILSAWSVHWLGRTSARRPLLLETRRPLDCQSLESMKSNGTKWIPLLVDFGRLIPHVHSTCFLALKTIGKSQPTNKLASNQSKNTSVCWAMLSLSMWRMLSQYPQGHCIVHTPQPEHQALGLHKVHNGAGGLRVTTSYNVVTTLQYLEIHWNPVQD